MTQKWNLQDIRPAEPRKRRVMQPPQSAPIQRPEEMIPERPSIERRDSVGTIRIEDGTKKRKKYTILIAVSAFIIIAIALSLSYALGKTELTVYPKFREPNINSEFTAYPERREDSLTYEILTLEATGESQVKASGQMDVTTKATGVIEIIKTTPGTERIIANTRFRSPDGKIFRISEAVVVPGAVNNVPGTIRASVVAEEAGEEYNLAANTRFDIPGFQESGLTDLYNGIYAENRAPFTGGFNGPQFQIDETELSTARQKLQVELRNKLLSEIEAKRPAGFVSFEGAVALTFNQLPAVEYGSDLVTIKEQAILQVPLFNSTDLGTFLAKEAVATYSGGTVRIEDPSVLSFEYVSATTSTSVIANEPSLSFRLRGRPLLIWEYDANQLKTDLAGKQKTAVTNALSVHQGLEGGKVHITPFWKRSFPDNAEEIVIIEELREE